ncbi:MAG: WD40/YVTN/BNR-like repeat-containing protein [Dehalococcoidia bacterium]
MANPMTLLVGTVGQGVMRSTDSGETWRRVGIGQGLHSDALVRSLVSHPTHPEIVFAGTDQGLYHSDDAGEKWQKMDSPLSPYCVWALTIDAGDPQTMYAGTGTPTPAALFRSADGGKTWEKSSMEAAAECANVGIPRVTGVAIDPVNRGNIWVGLEVDGVRHSSDGGDTWQTINGAIPNLDVHNVAVAGGPPKTVIVVVNNDVYTSVDDGATWAALDIRQKFPMTYPRGITVQPGHPNVIFVTIGDATPGRTGTVMRSKDTGQTWESLTLPVEPNTAMWVVNIEPADSEVVLAGSRYGYLYRSEDGGDSWTKLWREFSEISSVTWVPN